VFELWQQLPDTEVDANNKIYSIPIKPKPTTDGNIHIMKRKRKKSFMNLRFKGFCVSARVISPGTESTFVEQKKMLIRFFPHCGWPPFSSFWPSTTGYQGKSWKESKKRQNN
jgi:hypothetical protein